jgi:uncharacterized protein (DUF362 family)
MARDHSDDRIGSTRRSFLASVAATGLAASVPVGWYGLHRAAGKQHAKPAGDLAMPGKHPGKVVEINHAGSVRTDHSIDRDVVAGMMDRGMKELTGADHPQEAWKTFFGKGDVVGIKVNPVGRKPIPSDGGGRVVGAVGCISSPEVVVAIVAGLKSAGVEARDIIVFERYANEFIDAGYEQLMREPAMAGTRWYASSAGYSAGQVEIDGFGSPRSAYSPDLVKHVVGYDPDCFVTMDFDAPEQDRKDERRFRSHLSTIVTRMVDKIVNIPCLKDHRSAGITGALKNMSHGMNNNVARSHVGGMADKGSEYDNNRCGYFIPTAVDQRPLKEKATLHILDGLIGNYEGGPGCWNRTWGTWHYKGLFFATDPVALDRVCWSIVDAKRRDMGWPVVGEMGLIKDKSDSFELMLDLADHAPGGPIEHLTLRESARMLQAGRASEVFSMRQPEHILKAASLGLGIGDTAAIQHASFRIPT